MLEFTYPLTEEFSALLNILLHTGKHIQKWIHMSIAICIHKYSLRAILHIAPKETGSVFYSKYSGESRNPSVALKKLSRNGIKQENRQCSWCVILHQPQIFSLHSGTDNFILTRQNFSCQVLTGHFGSEEGLAFSWERGKGERNEGAN